jgi:hypothetical protein
MSFVYYESINREVKPDSQVVYYELIKGEVQIKPISECRCDERLKTKAEESTRLAYTWLHGELEHLKIKLINEKFASVMGDRDTTGKSFATPKKEKKAAKWVGTLVRTRKTWVMKKQKVTRCVKFVRPLSRSAFVTLFMSI